MAVIDNQNREKSMKKPNFPLAGISQTLPPEPSPETRILVPAGGSPTLPFAAPGAEAAAHSDRDARVPHFPQAIRSTHFAGRLPAFAPHSGQSNPPDFSFARTAAFPKESPNFPNTMPVCRTTW
jgi:hypothetical protein